jgi:Flp pilus assembly protein TadG
MMFARFWKSRDGSIIPMFAFAIIPVLGFVGLAIDYSGAGSARTAMQAALDATALMLSKDATKLSTSEMQDRATQYFNGMFNHTDVTGLTVTPTYNAVSNTYTLKVSAAGQYKGNFTNLLVLAGLGNPTMNIGGSSEVTWGMKRLELALALDNTGSMAQNNKMTELKKAAKSLLDTLYKAAKSTGDVKVAIIPFTTDVNVGTTNSAASWLDWSDWDNPTTGNGTMVTNCQFVIFGFCWTGSGWIAQAQAQQQWVPTSHATWTGCVYDRDQDNDVLDTAPIAGTKATMFPAHQPATCPVTLLPLSDILSNWTSGDVNAVTPSSVLGKKINAMTPNGNTNVTIGLAWGWHALTQNQPLPEGSAPALDLDKVLILLTDGDNTRNRWDSTSTGNNAAQQAAIAAKIDARTQRACDNIKAANIKLYTIRVIDGNAALLQGCATKTDMYYDVQDASQLNAVFGAIATNLANLRIAK